MGNSCGMGSQPPKEDEPSPAPAKAQAEASPPPAAASASSEEKGGELATENLLPHDEAFDTNITDMDSPNKPRKMSMDEGQASTVPVGAQSKKRFRKRSVNITTLPDDQLKAVEAKFAEIDKDSTGFIHRKDVALVLKESYKPSELEVQEVMQWMDSSGDDQVDFNEYMVAMASVMTKEGLNQGADIETARAALSREMQTLKASKQKNTMMASPDNIANAKTVIGETNLSHMEERFRGLDTAQKGFLGRDEVRELVKLTYVAAEENISMFMKFFNEKDSERGISLEEFKHGLTLLYGDFSFAITGATTSPRSPAAAAAAASP